MDRILRQNLISMPRFDQQVRSCLYGAALSFADADADAKNTTNLHVVIVGASKRVAQAYAEKILGAELPQNVQCLGLDEASNTYKKYSYNNATLIVMHDVLYMSDDTMGRIFSLLTYIVCLLKEQTPDRGQLLMLYQHPDIWRQWMQWGGANLRELMPLDEGITFVPKLASTIQLSDLSVGADRSVFDTDHICLGMEFHIVRPSLLVQHIIQIMIEMKGKSPNPKLTLLDSLAPVIFEQFINGQLQKL